MISLTVRRDVPLQVAPSSPPVHAPPDHRPPSLLVLLLERLHPLPLAQAVVAALAVDAPPEAAGRQGVLGALVHVGAVGTRQGVGGEAGVAHAPGHVQLNPSKTPTLRILFLPKYLKPPSRFSHIPFRQMGPAPGAEHSLTSTHAPGSSGEGCM